MNIRTIVVTLGAVTSLSSCGEAESGSCADRIGTYHFVFEETSGSCGEMAEQVVTLEEALTEIPASCTGKAKPSDDNCSVTATDLSCPEPGAGPGIRSVINSKYEWSRDASKASGVLNVRLVNATDRIECQSSYTATVERL